jgi:exosortase
MSGSAVPLRPRVRGDVMGWVAALGLVVVALVPLTAAWTQAQDLGHGWAVPLLAAYLWWERWDERPAGIARDRLGAPGWIAAALLVLLALPLRLLLTPFPLWPVVLAAYVVVLVAVALFGAWLWGGREGVRWVGGPLWLLAGALPWPTLLELKIVAPMREMLATAAAEVCYVSGVSALAAGTTLRLAHTWVGVDETCGGMRSLQASVMAALFFGEWLRLAWTRRVALVGIGAAAAVGGNFLRILLLVWRASVGGEAALNAAHDVAGWLALAVSLGLTGLVAWNMRGATAAVAASAAPPAVRPGGSRAAMAWSAAVVAALVAIEAGTRAWYWRGAIHQAATVAQWGVSFPDGERDFRVVALPEASREMLRPDFFAAGEWRDAQQRQVSAYYIEWRRGQAAHSIPFLHNPTVCLPMSGCELVRPLGIVPVRWAGAELPFRAYLFRRNREEFAVAFIIWDSWRGRPLEDESGSWMAWMKMRLSHVADARSEQPAQLLSVAVWGEHPEKRLPATIAGLIGRG